MKIPEETSDETMRVMGEKSVLSGILLKALELAGVDDLQLLLDIATGTLDDLERLWSEPRSELQTGAINEYTRVQFRIEQQLEIAQGNESLAGQLRFICAKCRLPFSHFDSKSVCIYCGTAEFIEVDRVEPPAE